MSLFNFNQPPLQPVVNPWSTFGSTTPNLENTTPNLENTTPNLENKTPNLESIEPKSENKSSKHLIKANEIEDSSESDYSDESEE